MGLKHVVQPSAKDYGNYENLPAGWTGPSTGEYPTNLALPGPPDPEPVAGVKRDTADTRKEPENIKSRRTEDLANAPAHEVQEDDARDGDYTISLRRKPRDEVNSEHVPPGVSQSDEERPSSLLAVEDLCHGIEHPVEAHQLAQGPTSAETIVENKGKGRDDSHANVENVGVEGSMSSGGRALHEQTRLVSYAPAPQEELVRRDGSTTPRQTLQTIVEEDSHMTDGIPQSPVPPPHHSTQRPAHVQKPQGNESHAVQHSLPENPQQPPTSRSYNQPFLNAPYTQYLPQAQPQHPPPSPYPHFSQSVYPSQYPPTVQNAQPMYYPHNIPQYPPYQPQPYQSSQYNQFSSYYAPQSTYGPSPLAHGSQGSFAHHQPSTVDPAPPPVPPSSFGPSMHQQPTPSNVPVFTFGSSRSGAVFGQTARPTGITGPEQSGSTDRPGDYSTTDDNSNASDASQGRKLKKIPRTSSRRNVMSRGKQTISREPSLVGQLKSASDTSVLQPPPIGSRRSLDQESASWPMPPKPDSAVAPQPSSSSNSTAGPSATIRDDKQVPRAESAVTAIMPHTASESVTGGTTTFQSRILQLLEEKDEESKKYLKFVVQNMQTREEAHSLDHKVESLYEEIASIRASQVILAASGRKRAFENAGRKGLRSALATAEAASSKGKGRANDTSEGEEEEAVDVKPSVPPPTSSGKTNSRSHLASNVVDLLRAHGNILRSSLRKHIMRMMGIKDYAMLPRKCPPLTEEEEEAYRLNLPNAPVVDPRRLRIDFEHPWKQYSYNREVAEVIVEDYLKTFRAPDSPILVPAELLNKSVIHDLLDAHMKTLRGTYNEYRKGTLDVVNALQKKKKKKNSKMSRRTTLFASRVMALIRRPALKHILAIMQLMSPRNMSEDEIDGPVHPPVYILRPARWQSEELRQCLHKLDELFRKDWEGGVRAGNPPRTLRLAPHGETSPVVAPAGLPRNCYDAAYLNGLRPHELAALCVDETLIDLSIPANIDVQEVKGEPIFSSMEEDET